MSAVPPPICTHAHKHHHSLFPPPPPPPEPFVGIGGAGFLDIFLFPRRWWLHCGCRKATKSHPDCVNHPPWDYYYTCHQERAEKRAYGWKVTYLSKKFVGHPDDLCAGCQVMAEGPNQWHISCVLHDRHDFRRHQPEDGGPTQGVRSQRAIIVVTQGGGGKGCGVFRRAVFFIGYKYIEYCNILCFFSPFCFLCSSVKKEKKLLSFGCLFVFALLCFVFFLCCTRFLLFLSKPYRI